MPFADDVRRFALKANNVTKDVFVNVVAATKDSITDGSPVTGSPGQPVRRGTLKASWNTEFVSDTEALISSGGAAAAYNKSIEDGVSYAHNGEPMQLRSEVGGFHSVALTAAGFSALVADEARKVVGP